MMSKVYHFLLDLCCCPRCYYLQSCCPRRCYLWSCCPRCCYLRSCCPHCCDCRCCCPCCCFLRFCMEKPKKQPKTVMGGEAPFGRSVDVRRLYLTPIPHPHPALTRALYARGKTTSLSSFRSERARDHCDLRFQKITQKSLIYMVLWFHKLSPFWNPV